MSIQINFSLRKAFFAFLTMLLSASAVLAQTTTFNYTGAVQTYTVPAGVTSVIITAKGAQGGDSQFSGTSGTGATITSEISVTPGEVLSVIVGGQPAPQSDGGGGGGASLVSGNPMSGTNIKIIAGGGGGSRGGGATILSTGTPAAITNGMNGTGATLAFVGKGSDGLTAGAGGITPNIYAGGTGGFGGGGGGGSFESGIGGYPGGGGTSFGSTVSAVGGIFSSGSSAGGGGGGGGFIGGNGADNRNNTAGGGTSYSSGTATVFTPASNSGNGSVVITPSVIIPTSSFLLCQNHINFSVDADCMARLTTASLGATAVAGSKITLKNGTAIFPGTTPAATLDLNVKTLGLLGKTYTYEVADATNKCWGTIKFEDKLAPTFDCPAPVDVTCNTDYKFSTSEVLIMTNGVTNTAGLALTTGLPTNIKECSNYTVHYSDSKALRCSANSVGTVLRTFRLTDQYGNTTTCTQTLTIVGGGTSFTTFTLPADVTVTDCAITDKTFVAANYAPGATRNGTVVPNYAVAGGDCMISATYTDKVTYNSCGAKIVRTWVVVNMCLGAVMTSTATPKVSQVITITDNQAPVFASALPDITISTGAATCLSSQEIPVPNVTDNCGVSTITLALKGITFTASNGKVNVTGVPVGTSVGVWTATDACGNATSTNQMFTVKDLVAPIAVADQNTNVALTLDCTATVSASSFDDGSWDNCCFDVNRFEVARMDGATVGTYGSTITFTKADLSKAEGTNNPTNLLAGCRGSVMIAFRVWDCEGNSNVAMVNVVVEDKIGPRAAGTSTEVVCGNAALGAQWFESWETQFKALNLLQYPPVEGTNPGYYDNCEATVTWGAISGTINQCATGILTRVATVKDKCDHSATATFTYTSTHSSKFEVTLPKNNKYTCPGSSVPTKADAIAAARASIKTIEGCPVVAVDIKSEEIMSAVANACYRIKRTWVVSSLCHTGMRKGDIGLSDAVVMGTSADYVYKSELDGTTLNGSILTDDKYVEYVQVIEVNDSEKPTITQPQEPKLIAAGKCGLTMTIGGFQANDACAETVAKTWTLLDATKTPVVGTASNPTSGSTFPYSYTFATADYGKTFIVRYRAEDRCGNIEIKDFEVKPKDITKPSPVCYQGLSADLMPTTGEVWVSAAMFDAGSSDGCGVDASTTTILPAVSNPLPATNARMYSKDKTVELRIERGNPAFGSGIPSTNMIWIGCVGIVPIRVWAIDAAGNADYCDTYIDIQNNMGATPKNGNCTKIVLTGARIAGDIKTANGKVVENAVLYVNSSLAANPFKAHLTAGNYTTFVPNGSDLKVTADKNDNPLNGISTYDLVLMSKHILGTAVISDKYAQIAADVNNSSKITTADMVELRKMILGIQPNFSNNKSWRFFDANMKEEATFTNVIDEVKVNFTAVKTGDINGNANAASAPRTVPTHEFVTADKSLVAGETVELALNGTEGFGFTMNYDAKSLEVVAIDANSALIENGTITTAQVGTEFKVTFKATANVTLSNAIALSSQITDAEAVVNGEVANIALKFNNAATAFELFQNQPNPFHGATTISFASPAANDYVITVTDLAGRLVKSMNGQAVKGLNTVSVELNNAGVYNYTVTSGHFTATKKMIVLE